MKDVSMRKGSLVCAYAAPRRAAKKFVYVIGGSHRELGSAWTKEEYTYDSVERYDIYAKQWRQVRKKMFLFLARSPFSHCAFSSNLFHDCSNSYPPIK